MFEEFVRWVRQYYHRPEAVVHLHETHIAANEYNYIKDCLNSGIVSSVGSYVEELEERICAFTGAQYAVGIVNGTSGLHIALLLTGVQAGDLVITQPFTFVATGNAIRYTGADPVFLDIDRQTLGLSPQHLEDFLKNQTVRQTNDFRYHKASGRRIAACLPVHTFGHPAAIDEIADICNAYHIPLIEDAAEALGSRYQQQHVGNRGAIGVFSFNGNKVVTSGGGGMMVTNDQHLAAQALHLTTQARTKEEYSYFYDQVGYNYRMPNLNAALGCAQMENLDLRLQKRKTLAEAYRGFWQAYNVTFIETPPHAISNYWMQSVMFESEEMRDAFVRYTNAQGIHVRPAWRLLPRFPMFRDCFQGDLANAELIEKQLACLPSAVVI